MIIKREERVIDNEKNNFYNITFFFTSVNALNLDEITAKLKTSNTYYMYQNMGDTIITNNKNKITIKYPSIRDDKKFKTINYTLKNNTLENTFNGDISNRYDVLDNNALWALEIIDIIASLNGNSDKEILSINEDYLKNTNFNEDKIEVKYSDYSIINLEGELEKDNIITGLKISLDYKIKEDKIDLASPIIKLIKLSKDKITLSVSSNLENITCDLYYSKDDDDFSYEKVGSIDCSKDSSNNKITIDVKEINNYYFKAYIHNHLISSDTLSILASDFKGQNNYLVLLIISITILGFIIFRRIKINNDL